MASISEQVKNLVADINAKVQGEVTAATEAVISEVRDNIIGPAVSNINNSIQLLATKSELSDYAKKSDVKEYDDTNVKSSISTLQSNLEALTARVQALENAMASNVPQEEEPPAKEEPKEESLEP